VGLRRVHDAGVREGRRESPVILPDAVEIDDVEGRVVLGRQCFESVVVPVGQPTNRRGSVIHCRENDVHG